MGRTRAPSSRLSAPLVFALGAMACGESRDGLLLRRRQMCEFAALLAAQT